MRNPITTAREVAGALNDLRKAQGCGDQAALDAALDRGHQALRGTGTGNPRS